MTSPRGLLLLDKPSGMTSFQAIRRLKACLPGAKTGHSGTLDPLATGLLVVLLGEATKAAPFLEEEPKVYAARVLLGVETDTYDTDGRVMREAPVPQDEAAIIEALESLKGARMQQPPPFSAAKFKGKPLYRYARRGEAVEGRPRRVEVYDVDVGGISWEGERCEAELTLSCSRGTYVRSLCKEVGDKLGCGGALAGLRRLAAGPFRVEEALGLDRWVEKLERGDLQGIISITEALSHLPRVTAAGKEAAKVRNGHSLQLPEDLAGRVVMVVDGDGAPLALHAAAEGGGGASRVLRVFNLKHP